MRKYFMHIVIAALFTVFLIVPTHSAFACSGTAADLADPTCAAIYLGTKAVGKLPGFTFDVVTSLLSPIALGLLKLVSVVMFLAGTLLNFAIHYTIIDMKAHLTDLGGINIAWSVIRDIANMFFIFMLLYTSIMTIFGEGNYKRTIVNMIIAAVLINFSLFFTKVVIDAGNLLALTFYDIIAPGAASKAIGSAGIASSFMNALKLPGIYDIAKNAITINGSQLFIVGILGSVFELIAAFVFFAVALMFISRYVILLFVLILSPIFFASYVLPQLEPYRKKWKDALISQTFFPVVYFILTWVILTLMNSKDGSGKTFLPTSDWAGTLNGVYDPATGVVKASSALGTVFGFILVIALMIISLFMAKEMSNKSSFGINKWISEKAGGATFGLAGRFGRGTVGRLGQVVADNETIKKHAPTSRLARLALAAGGKTAGASFDLRATGLNKQLGGGKAQSGGFTADMKAKVKAQEKVAETFKPSDLVVAEAERELDNIKKTGTQKEIADAQRKVDELKGVNEDEARKRKIREMREASGWEMTEKEAKRKLSERESTRLRTIQNIKTTQNITQAEAEKKFDAELADEIKSNMNGGMSEAQARQKAEEKLGANVKSTDSAAAKRQKEYAKTVEEQRTFGVPFDWTGRIGFVGPVKKEYLASANAIRKKVKEKKPADKMAEEAAKVAKEAAEDNEPDTTPSSGGSASGSTGGTSGGGSAPAAGPTTP